LQDNEYRVIARGEFAVPPNPTTETAVANFWMDVSTNILHWYISHNMGGDLDAVRLRKAPKGSTGSTQVAIDFLQSVNVTPISGSSIITPTQTVDVLNGEWYLYMRDDGGGPVMRAQIESITGVKGGGTVPQLHFEFPTGGTESGGAADIDFIYNITASSNGAECGGKAETSFSVDTKGGAEVNGTADILHIHIPQLSGGIVCGGIALEDSIFNITTSGGVLGGGPKGIIGIAPKIGGGSTGGGATGFLWIYNPVILGGGLVNGTARVTFFDIFVPLGGLRVGGNSLGERLKVFVEVGNQRNLAHKSDNILNEPEVDTNKLIPPTNEISPLLDDGRFRIQHNPGWCDVDEVCEEGVLAEVIVKRQKGYVPPKVRKNTRRDRRVATAL
jgi:hypothetical protein